MAIKPQHDEPLPDSLVAGMTSLMLKSSLQPAQPPYKSELFEQQGGRCNGCKLEFKFADFDVDHVIPRAAGGTYYIDNLQLLCRRCNQLKGNGTQDNLITRLRKLGIAE